jgi:inorganic triphosphatase YgiF
MPQSQEIELKLDVPTSYIGRLDRLSLLKGTRPEKTSTLLSTYFDTEKQKLQKKGVSLRVRACLNLARR